MCEPAHSLVCAKSSDLPPPYIRRGCTMLKYLHHASTQEPDDMNAARHDSVTHLTQYEGGDGWEGLESFFGGVERMVSNEL